MVVVVDRVVVLVVVRVDVVVVVGRVVVVGPVVVVVGRVVVGMVVVVPDRVPELPQATPLTANAAGTELAVVQVPWNPKPTVRPLGTALFQPTLVALACPPVTAMVAFQALVTACPSGKIQVTVQPLSGSPLLRTATSATNPPGHCEVTV